MFQPPTSSGILVDIYQWNVSGFFPVEYQWEYTDLIRYFMEIHGYLIGL